jgi:hypothetical protein
VRSVAGSGRITSLTLSNYFTVVGIDDCDAAACMSYYRLGPEVCDNLQRQLSDALPDDPLLYRTLFEESGGWLAKDLTGFDRYMLFTALRATVLSAISARILHQGGDDSFEVSSKSPQELLSGAEHAVVVGFGGYMHTLARRAGLKSLHVADMQYDSRRDEIDGQCQRFRVQFPAKRFSASDGRDLSERLRDADFVCITGSALSNGTLDALLQQAGGGKRIIVQGQSSAIHPKCMFESGVDLVATTLKPRGLLGLGATDPSGTAIQAMLEGGLPWIYLRPRNGGVTSLGDRIA